MKGQVKNLKHEKWIKDFAEGNISIKEQSYALSVTDNKRQLVYDDSDKLIATEPYKIDSSKSIVADCNTNL